jgi:hypothetical protein
MNCDSTRQYIYQGSVSENADLPDAVHSHLQDCAECRALFEKELTINRCFFELQHDMRDAEPTAVSDNSARVLNRALQQIERDNKARTRRTFNFGMGAGLGFALAASLFIALFGNVLLTDPGNGVTNPLTSIQMIDSPEAVAEANITLHLPQHIRVAGYEKQDKLTWNTALKAGKNKLRLPLIASMPGKSVLVSELRVNGQSRLFRLELNVTPQSGSTSAFEQADV